MTSGQICPPTVSCSLSLVGWDVEASDPAVHPYLRLVYRHLDALEWNLRFRFSRHWWQPTDDQFRKLAFAMRYGCTNKIEELVPQSYQYDTQLWSDAGSPDEASADEPHDLCAAVAELHAAHARPDDIDRRQAWQHFHESIGSAISQPPLAKSLLTADPEERSRLTAMATFAPMALAELTLLANKMTNPSSDWRQAQAPLADRDLQRALELVHALTSQTTKAQKRARS